jgi:hypothetical protein
MMERKRTKEKDKLVALFFVFYPATLYHASAPKKGSIMGDRIEAVVVVVVVVGDGSLHN